MTAPRNPDRLIHEFLEEGRTELPDRAYDAVRAQIDHTRQRVYIGPWRLQNLMNVYARYAIGAAAIVLVALLGIQLFSQGGIGAQPTHTPTATPAPTPTAAPTAAPTPTAAPSVTPLGLGHGGALAPGTYTVGDPFLVPMTFTVPGAWQASVGGPNALWLYRTGGPSLSFVMVDKVYADPCDFSKGPLEPQPGPSAAALASALANLPNLVVSPVTDTSVGGYSGKHLTLTAPSTFDGCTLAPGDPLVPSGLERVWDLPLDATNDLKPRETEEIWVLDVGSNRLVIQSSQNAQYQNGPFADELQGVVDSVVFTPTN